MARLKMPKTREGIEAEIRVRTEELQKIEASERERFGALALAAGLADVKIENAEVEAAFRQLAATFRAKSSEPPA